MSIQTGQELPPARASDRLVDRVRYRVAVAIRDPNPIWIRELKQSARLTRTPIILMIISLLMTLVIASLGGTMSTAEPADKIGVTLYHTYFSIAFFVVTLVGPAVAANAVASEREGRTWDAILLTGLSPERIARGKFLASFTAISTYIVMLAPVGAFAFLFGGVTATEVAIAFIDLFLVAAVFVSLGLAISAKLQTLRASIVVTLLLAVPFAAFLYVFFGMGASEGIHSLWPRVPGKLPVWLPTAYLRGEPGVEYALLLFVLPSVALTVSTWFCYESTVANLRDDNDDRGFGLKRWYLVSLPLVVGAAEFAELALDDRMAEPIAVMGVLATMIFLGFSVLVFGGEPVGPSRRVRAARVRAKQGPLRRRLGPSVTHTGYLQLVWGAAALIVEGVVGARRMSTVIPRPHVDGFTYFVAYGVAFFVFSVGLSVWLRARATSPTAARVLFVVTVVGLSVVPWVVAAVSGALTRDESGLLIASPSPFFSVVMYQAASDPSESDKIVAGLVCIGAWATLGGLLLLAGARRAREINRANDRAASETDAMLAAEEQSSDAASEASVDAA